ncbi:hypothetical protein PG991_001449, partial [Apiospora marii]
MEQDYGNWGSLTPSQQAEALANHPAVEPPDGIVPNFDNPPTNNDIGIPIVVTFLVMVVITGSLRMYSRVAVVRAFKLEDCIHNADLGLGAYIVFIGLTAMFLRMITSYGFMVDEWNITLGASNEWTRDLWIYRLIYAFVMLFAKTAILLEWKSIFVPTKKRNWFFWATTAMATINILAYTIAFIMTIFRCKPVTKIWRPWLQGTCSEQKSTDVATTFINLFLDILILLLPQPIIWKLKMTRQRRVGVSLIFSIGLLVHANMVLDYVGNTTSGGSVALIWAYGESACVMMVFAAPAIPKAFKNHNFLSGVVLVIRSWSRLGDSTQDVCNYEQVNDKRIVRTIGGGGGEGRVRKPTATELALMETQDLEDVEAGAIHTAVVDPTPCHTQQERSILKTTVLDTREDSASKAANEQMIERQHPWLD